MSRPFIVLGDQTDHGGVVIEASVMTDTHGKGIARVGDQVTCPKRNHGTTVIVTGDPTMIIDGKAAARHGDKCACGATLISSQFVSTVGGSGGGGSAASTASHDHDADPMGSPQSASQDSGTDHADDVDGFNQRFLVTNTQGNPMANAPYVITLDSGVRIEGRTDAEGMTNLISSASAETATLEVLHDEPPLNPTWDR
jgi:uncharacterized Zn-binding protein involved in type VI secretion